MFVRTQTYTPVEIVGYEVIKARILESLDSGSVNSGKRHKLTTNSKPSFHSVILNKNYTEREGYFYVQF